MIFRLVSPFAMWTAAIGGVVSVIAISLLASKSTRHASHVLVPPNPEIPQPPSRSTLHVYRAAAVCSDALECSKIGSHILQLNGSAVDAAIATLLCNGLLAMQSMGLGGGLLMNVYSRSERQAYGILAREVAPLASEKFDSQPNSRATNDLFHSAGAIGVPTEVMGYAMAHQRFGRLPWSQLVRPTVELCQRGYKLSKHQRDALYTNAERVRQDRHLGQMFIDPDSGQFLKVGAPIQPPAELCETYTLLAEQGPQTFYEGVLAKRVLDDLHELGSAITEQDFSTMQVKVVPAVVLALEEHGDLHLMPAPGSGHILGLVMNILQHFRPQFAQASGMASLEMHRIAEALKFGFAQRWQLDMQMSELHWRQLMCPHFAQRLANRINDTHTFAELEHYGASEALLARNEKGTGHVSVLAPNGDAVAVTSSINFYFGTGGSGRRTGIVFNNALADFSIAGHPNYFGLPNVKAKNCLQPGVSPISSMAPTIVTDGKGGVRLVIGAAGGTKIISALTQVLVRVLWLGETIKEAIDAARFHHQLRPDVLEYEYGVQQQFVDSLEAKGHRTHRYRERGSAVCGIERHKGRIQANADYRKEGGVAGF